MDYSRVREGFINTDMEKTLITLAVAMWNVRSTLDQTKVRSTDVKLTFQPVVQVIKIVHQVPIGSLDQFTITRGLDSSDPDACVGRNLLCDCSQLLAGPRI